MTVSDNTKATESLGDFFRNLCQKRNNVSKKMAKNDLKNPGKALEIGGNHGTAFASRILKMALQTLYELILFFHTRKNNTHWEICKIFKMFLFQFQKMRTPTMKRYPSAPQENTFQNSGWQKNWKM